MTRPCQRGASVAMLAAGLASAQAPAFDVASVRVSSGERPPGGYHHQITPLGLTMLHVSMGYCIRLAYGISLSYELSGPAWLDPPTDREFDVAAKVSTPTAPDQIRLMLRTLLAERFKLAIHREKRYLPAYSLQTAEQSPSLQPADRASPTAIKGGKAYELLFTNVSMAQLALQLGPPMTSRPVVDRTGLAGGFDFRLDITPYVLDPETGKTVTDGKGMIDTEGATLRAVREQLGLVLKADRAPVEIWLVDRVEKAPTAN